MEPIFLIKHVPCIIAAESRSEVPVQRASAHPSKLLFFRDLIV